MVRFIANPIKENGGNQNEIIKVIILMINEMNSFGPQLILIVELFSLITRLRNSNIGMLNNKTFRLYNTQGLETKYDY